MKKIVFVVLLLLSGIHSYGQGRPDYFKIANEAYEKGNYLQAIQLYQNLLTDAPDTTLSIYPFGTTYRGYGFVSLAEINNISYKLAECYLRVFDYVNTEKQFAKAKALNDKNLPLAQYYYAQSLLANGKYAQAADEFKEYGSGSSLDAKQAKAAELGRKSALYATDATENPDKIIVRKLPRPINDSSSSFSPFLIRNGKELVFAGGREEQVIIDTLKGEYQQGNVKSVFLSSLQKCAITSDSTYGGVVGLDLPKSRNSNVGTPSFSKDEKMLFYTQWNGNYYNGEYNIYLSRREGSLYKKTKRLPKEINASKSINMMPYWSDFDSTLYFVSNREGGIGGFDIWYSKMNTKEEFSEPINLGGLINTQFDEITPYFSESNSTLYYSTNGVVGMGGLDVVRSKKLDDNKWATPENLGYPVNSSRQDAYYVTTDNAQIAYFASDRSDCKNCQGTSCYNLYNYTVPKNNFKGTVIDGDNGNTLISAKVTMIDETNNVVVGKTVTNNNGTFRFPIQEGVKYRVEAENIGYLTGTYKFETPAVIKIGSDIEGKIQLLPALGVLGKLIDSETLQPIDSADIIMINKKTEQEVGRFKTNSLGQFTAPVDRNTKYQFIARRNGYLASNRIYEVKNAIDTGVALTMAMAKIVIDKPIVINNIFYDFGKATLRKESEKGLDTLYLLMYDNPNITIELGAHTDSKGNDEANNKLSDARAESVVKYLMKKGIERSRMIAKGYGESTPVAPNQNEDGSDNPEGRQKNRRTEFKILKVN